MAGNLNDNKFSVFNLFYLFDLLGKLKVKIIKTAVFMSSSKLVHLNETCVCIINIWKKESHKKWECNLIVSSSPNLFLFFVGYFDILKNTSASHPSSNNETFVKVKIEIS